MKPFLIEYEAYNVGPIGGGERDGKASLYKPERGIIPVLLCR